ncbi:MAG: glucose-6-phosphate dehydrogenase [Actinomycetota bacterium]|nr:glucose-6-phosphate dehydrogenase [Actinomycetota bacterium]PLS75989.1 MAG: glucose-6-phosphate dehydrogenase [Actinomycetota bacterium]
MTADNPLLEGLEVERRAPPCVLVVFGASGDLSSRKLGPALEALADNRQLPLAFSVVGVARTEMSDDDFRRRMLQVVKKPSAAWERLVAGFRYVTGDYTCPETFEQLRRVLDEVDEERGTAGNRVYYLATVPEVFAGVASSLGEHGLNQPKREGAFVRLVVEKPFGRDLQSSHQLDETLHESFREDQLYRIDHYLGKETVQNVLALRFANSIFEPIWNRRYIDHVQITVAESLGVGHRGGFYERAGALRDIVQNHVLQVLGLTLMEPPATVDAKGIRDEKVKALRAIDILRPEEVATEVVRAQYEAGWAEGEMVRGYREEEGVAPDSRTETYVAMKVRVDNWRWAGVPFYVRTGKCLPKRVTEVAMQFHGVPHLPFASGAAQGLEPNALVLRIQPDEGITLRFGAKVPGQAFEVRSVSMDFSYGAAFLEETPEAYERLLLDAMVGDPTLFIRADEVEQAWVVVEPLLNAWAADEAPLARYPAGTWGPREADRLLESDGRRWRSP